MTHSLSLTICTQDAHYSCHFHFRRPYNFFFLNVATLNLTLPHKCAHFYFWYSHTNQPHSFPIFFSLSLSLYLCTDWITCAHKEQQQQQQQEKVVFNTLMNFPMMLACLAEQKEMQTLIPSACFYNTCSITKIYFWFFLPECISVKLASVEI